MDNVPRVLIHRVPNVNAQIFRSRENIFSEKDGNKHKRLSVGNRAFVVPNPPA
jgi:hypothetical protein